MTRLILPTLVLVFIRVAPLATAAETPYIEVRGTATQKAPVDKILWSLRIRNVDSELSAAAKSIDESYQSLKHDLEAFSIPNLQIRAAEVSSGREYERGRDQQKFIGFYAERGLTVTVLDLARIGEVQARLLRDDRIAITFVSRTSTQEVSLKAIALQRAAEAARAKANQLAKTLDIKIGKALVVVDGGVTLSGAGSAFNLTSNSINQPVFSERDGSELDEVSVTQTVTVKYAIAE